MSAMKSHGGPSMPSWLVKTLLWSLAFAVFVVMIFYPLWAPDWALK